MKNEIKIKMFYKIEIDTKDIVVTWGISWSDLAHPLLFISIENTETRQHTRRRRRRRRLCCVDIAKTVMEEGDESIA